MFLDIFESTVENKKYCFKIWFQICKKKMTYGFTKICLEKSKEKKAFIIFGGFWGQNKFFL